MSSVKYQPFCLNLSVLNFHLHSEDNELISFCFGALSERSPICKSTGDTKALLETFRLCMGPGVLSNLSLTHWGLVTPYGDMELGQHWFK